MKILVLAGGLSPERDVSLSSGGLIANALKANGHEVSLADLYLGTVKHRDFDYAVPQAEPDLDALKKHRGLDCGEIGPGVMELCKKADAVFVALHGGIGENGQLQAALEINGVRFTGTGSTGCMLAMDKDIAKRLMRQSGIATPDWELGEPRGIALPCVVKPLDCGSSVGVSIVREQAEHEQAIAAAKRHGGRVMIEKLVEGREFSAGVLDGKALPIIEIIPKRGFYDYANKYQPGFTTEICPANLPRDITGRIQASALAVHRALRLGYYSRVDFMLDANGSHYCLEANTLPGMTPTSLFPQEAKAAGISYEELCERIVHSSRG